MKKLAIIIPAYKGTFFERMLKSLAEQTCKDFAVYIGIDASPFDFETIIRKYSDALDIHATRFPDNLGGKDLVAQWERCVKLSRDEEWLWLFSDDDYLHKDCVKVVLEALQGCSHHDLLHLQVQVVDENDAPVMRKEYDKAEFPQKLSAVDYVKGRLRFKYNSFVVEYIFSRENYIKHEGFTNIDLAWGSDDATWAKFTHEGKILSTPDGTVYWRSSNVNISPNLKPEMARRKIKASLTFLRELKKLFGHTIASDARYFLLRRLVNYSSSLTNKEIDDVLKEFRLIYGLNIPDRLLLPFYTIVRTIKSFIK